MQKLILDKLAALLLFTLVSTFKAQSFGNELIIDRDFRTAALKFAKIAETENFTPATCPHVLKGIYEAIYPLSPDHFTDYQGIFAPAIATNPINAFFKGRLRIHSKIRDWVWENQFSSYQELAECTQYLKVTTRTLRTFEDYWGLVKLTQEEKVGENSHTPFTGEWPQVMVNAKYGANYDFKKDVKSGDIILSRGTLFSGATISRVANVDNQFSHLAMVFVDEDGSLMGVPGEKYVSEAIFDGLQIIPLDEYLSHPYARAVHFRWIGNNHWSAGENKTVSSLTEAQMTKVRETAARQLAELAKTRTIGYNFAMDMSVVDNLFCSQAVAYGYASACTDPNLGFQCPSSTYQPENRLYPFPLVYSRLPMGHNSWVEMLGIKEKEIFVPADVEADPQLEIVAEWRDFSQIENSRVHDLILTKLFQWMEVGGYKLKTTDLAADIAAFADLTAKSTGKLPPTAPSGFVTGSLLIGYLVEAKGLKWELVKPVFENLKSQSDEDIAKVIIKFYKEMELAEATALVKIIRPQLENLSQEGRLEKVVSFVGFEKRLLDLNSEFVKKYGLSPTDFVYDSAMEQILKIACKDFKDGTKVRFHDFFAIDFSEREKACDENMTYDWRVLW